MKLLGERLIGPRIASTILAIYALVYALMTMTMMLNTPFSTAWLVGLVLLAMACTPFAARIHLKRAVDPAPRRPARPGVMAVVMAVPAVFWSWPSGYIMVPVAMPEEVSVWFRLFLFIGMPAILSLWLMITFILL